MSSHLPPTCAHGRAGTWWQGLSLLVRIFCLGISTYPLAGHADIDYRFESHGSEAALEARFSVPGHSECVLQTIFDLAHLQTYLDRSTRLEVVHQAEGENTVDFVYDGLLFSGRFRYRRLLRVREGEIRVELISGQTRGLFAPDVERSAGGYRVQAAGRGSEVSYEEHTRFATSLFNFAHVRAARTKALRFLENVRTYLLDTCPAVGSERANPARWDVAFPVPTKPGHRVG